MDINQEIDELFANQPPTPGAPTGLGVPVRPPPPPIPEAPLPFESATDKAPQGVSKVPEIEPAVKSAAPEAMPSIDDQIDAIFAKPEPVPVAPVAPPAPVSPSEKFAESIGEPTIGAATRPLFKREGEIGIVEEIQRQYYGTEDDYGAQKSSRLSRERYAASMGTEATGLKKDLLVAARYSPTIVETKLSLEALRIIAPTSKLIIQLEYVWARNRLAKGEQDPEFYAELERGPYGEPGQRIRDLQLVKDYQAIKDEETRRGKTFGAQAVQMAAENAPYQLRFRIGPPADIPFVYADYLDRTTPKIEGFDERGEPVFSAKGMQSGPQALWGAISSAVIDRRTEGMGKFIDLAGKKILAQATKKVAPKFVEDAVSWFTKTKAGKATNYVDDMYRSMGLNSVPAEILEELPANVGKALAGVYDQYSGASAEDLSRQNKEGFFEAYADSVMSSIKDWWSSIPVMAVSFAIPIGAKHIANRISGDVEAANVLPATPEEAAVLRDFAKVRMAQAEERIGNKTAYELKSMYTPSYLDQEYEFLRTESDNPNALKRVYAEALPQIMAENAKRVAAVRDGSLKKDIDATASKVIDSAVEHGDEGPIRTEPAKGGAISDVKVESRDTFQGDVPVPVHDVEGTERGVVEIRPGDTLTISDPATGQKITGKAAGDRPASVSQDGTVVVNIDTKQGTQTIPLTGRMVESVKRPVEVPISRAPSPDKAQWVQGVKSGSVAPALAASAVLSGNVLPDSMAMELAGRLGVGPSKLTQVLKDTARTGSFGRAVSLALSEQAPEADRQSVRETALTSEQALNTVASYVTGIRQGTVATPEASNAVRSAKPAAGPAAIPAAGPAVTAKAGSNEPSSGVGQAPAGTRAGPLGTRVEPGRKNDVPPKDLSTAKRLLQRTQGNVRSTRRTADAQSKQESHAIILSAKVDEATLGSSAFRETTSQFEGRGFAVVPVVVPDGIAVNGWTSTVDGRPVIFIVATAIEPGVTLEQVLLHEEGHHLDLAEIERNIDIESDAARGYRAQLAIAFNQFNEDGSPDLHAIADDTLVSEMAADIYAGLSNHLGVSLASALKTPARTLARAGEIRERASQKTGTGTTETTRGPPEVSTENKQAQKDLDRAVDSIGKKPAAEIRDTLDKDLGTQFSVKTQASWERRLRGEYPQEAEAIIAAVRPIVDSELAKKHELGREDDGSPIRSNTDYIFTVDFDTKCPKQVMFRLYDGAVYSKIKTADEFYGPRTRGMDEKAREKFIKPHRTEERWAIVFRLAASGVDAPCPYCYVESRRISRAEYGAAGGVTNTPKGYSPYSDQIITSLATVDEMAGISPLEHLNLRAGLRWLSNTDMKPSHIVDMLQGLGHLDAAHGLAHAYTKTKMLVQIAGNTGLKINMSMFPKLVNGRIEFDPSAGHSEEFLKEMMRKFPANVSGMAVATNEEIILRLMRMKHIGQIIPYHASGLRQDIFQAMGWEDFEDDQHETWLETPAAQRARDVSVARISAAMKELVDKKPGRAMALLNPMERYWTVSRYFSGIPNYRLGGKAEENFRKMAESYVPPIGYRMFFDPGAIEHGSSPQASFRYLQLAKANHLVPKFARFLNKDMMSFRKDVTAEGYMKLITDVAAWHTPHTVIDVTKADTRYGLEVLEQFDKAGGDAIYAKVNDKVVASHIADLHKLRSGQHLGQLIKSYSQEIMPEPRVRFVARPSFGPRRFDWASYNASIKGNVPASPKGQIVSGRVVLGNPAAEKAKAKADKAEKLRLAREQIKELMAEPPAEQPKFTARPVVRRLGDKFEIFVKGQKVGQAYISRGSTEGRYKLDAIDINEDQQRKGYGTKLMEAVAKHLKGIGASELVSSNEGSGTVQMLERVFGKENVEHMSGGSVISSEEARKITDVDYGYTHSRVTLDNAGVKAKQKLAGVNNLSTGDYINSWQGDGYIVATLPAGEYQFSMDKRAKEGRRVSPGEITRVRPKGTNKWITSVRESTAPSVLYHGTTQGALRKIASEGIKPTSMGQVSLSSTEQYAKTYADRKGGSRGIVLRVSGVSATPDNRISIPGDFKTAGAIPPESIEVKMPDGKWARLSDVDVSIGTPEYKPAPSVIADNATITPPEFMVRAFHGTPHTFDKEEGAPFGRVKKEKVGTGEGAAAYGWGVLYLAESEAVAQQYQENLSGRTRPSGDYRYQGRLVSNWQKEAQDNQKYTEARIWESIQLHETKNQIESYIHRHFRDEPEKEREAMRFLSKLPDSLFAKPAGNVYHVEVDADPEDMLEWETDVSLQSDRVVAALKKAGIKVVRRPMEGPRFAGGPFVTNPPIQTTTGESLYRALSLELGLKGALTTTNRSDQAASGYLSSLGIKGIRYADQGSRNLDPYSIEQRGAKWAVIHTASGVLQKEHPTLKAAQEDVARRAIRPVEKTYNYVIFNESDIRVVGRNGEMLTPTEAAAEQKAEPMFMARVTPEQDRAYMNAAEKGDIKTAQAMVDEAAKKAGYTIKGFHGTDKAGFSVFTTENASKKTPHGTFFSESAMGASSYSGVKSPAKIGEDPHRGIYSVYLRMNDPMIVDARGSNWDDIVLERSWRVGDDLDGEFFYDEAEAKKAAKRLGVDVEESTEHNTTDELLERAKDAGHDGIILNNISDEGMHGQGYNWDSKIYGVLSPSQIKSADAITRDESGRIVPLSEQFNSGEPDIRFMAREPMGPGRRERRAVSIERAFGDAGAAMAEGRVISKLKRMAGDRINDEIEKRRELTAEYKRQIRDSKWAIYLGQQMMIEYATKMLPPAERSKVLPLIKNLALVATEDKQAEYAAKAEMLIDQMARTGEENFLRKRLTDVVNAERRRMAKATGKGKKYALAEDYGDRMRQYLDAISTLSEGKREELERIQRHFEERPEEEMPDSVRARLGDLLRPSINQMNGDQMAEALRDINEIRKLGRLKSELRKKANAREESSQATAASQAMQKTSGIPLDKDSALKRTMKRSREATSFRARRLEGAKKYLVERMTPQRIALFMEGYSKLREFTRNTMDPLRRAQSEEWKGVEAVTRAAKEITAGFDVQAAYLTPVANFQYDDGTSDTVTLAQAMEIVALSRDPGGMNHLIGTGISEEMVRDLQAQLDSGAPEVRNANEVIERWFAYARDVQYPRMNRVFRAEHGVDMPRVDAYIRILNLDTPRNISPENAIMMDMMNRAVPKGMTIRRSGSKAPIGKFDFFENITKTMLDAEHYIAFNAAIQKVNRFLRNPEVKLAMTDRSEEMTRQFNKLIEDVAIGRVRTRDDAMGNGLLMLRSNAMTAILGVNIPSLLLQPASGLLGASRLDNPLHMLASQAAMVSNPKAMIDRVFSYSPMMKQRIHNFQREIAELRELGSIERFVGKRPGSEVAKALQKIPNWRQIGEGVMKLQGIMDLSVTIPLWDAAYNEEMAKHDGDPAFHEKAVRSADENIQMTQQMGDLLSLPQGYRGGALARLFTTFTYSINQNVMNALDIFTSKDPLKKKLAVAFIGLIGQALLVWLVQHGFRWPGSNREIAQMTTDQFAGAFPGWGQLVNPVNAIIFGGQKQDVFSGGLNLPPGLSILDELVKSGNRWAFDIDRGNSLFDGQGFLSLLSAGAQATGVPGYIQARRTYKGLEEYDKQGDWRYLIWSRTALTPQGTERD